MNRSMQKMGLWAVIAIVALRLGIGWHFYKEGAKKFRDGFSAAGFLAAAKGPLAETHKSMLADRWGFDRLNRDKTAQFWNNYRAKVESKLRFNADQSKRAQEVVNRYVRRLEQFLNDNAEGISEYQLEVKRLQDAKRDKLADVSFQQQRLAEKEWELRGKAAPWLAGVKTYGEQLENDLHAIADASQLRTRVAIPDRSTSFADTLAKYVVLSVGVLLILGLFTRLAALAGMGFLLTVMSTQPPWVEGADTQYFYYQLVEVLAFFVLFVFAAGRYCGLDFIIHGLLQRKSNPA